MGDIPQQQPQFNDPVKILSDQTALGQRILQISQAAGVSDFYVTPWEPVAYKYNGGLRYDTYVYQPDVAFRVDSGTDDYALTLGARRFRVNRMTTRGKYRWVLRLLPEVIPDPADIAVPHGALKALMEAKNGVFLICGPTGSGKTTTIASMLKYRAERRREHFVTFEDPIEYIYPDGLPTLVSQREVGEDEHDFGKALRASLRQAPDVILIGEIRDGETAEIALQAAETGHVVVATLHTSSASGTVQRFLKLITPERVEAAQSSLADILRMVMCQTLVLDEEKGRRFAIHEMLLQYDSTANLIRRGEFKKLDQELETGFKRGMMSFEKCAELRAAEGWRSNLKEPSGFTAEEVSEYMRNADEKITA